MHARILQLDSTDPYYNLAVEEVLLDTCSPGTITMMLWQNAHTVVIGRHQNAWRECRLSELEQDGGRLARRITGGGAVYHDMGNLNFSFVASKGIYDEVRQTGVVLSCVRALGIPAAFQGRNDLVADGAKFSGHAYCHRQETSLHHGTLLLDVDLMRLAGYLNPDPEKMKSHSVASVRARVVNLSDFAPDLTIPALKAAMENAFIAEYGTAQTLHEGQLPQPRIQALAQRNASFDWRVGRSPAGDALLSHRFPWGLVELSLTVLGGIVSDVSVHSDAMDESLIALLPNCLTGCRYDGSSLAAALRGLPQPEAGDIAQWLIHAVC